MPTGRRGAGIDAVQTIPEHFAYTLAAENENAAHGGVSFWLLQQPAVECRLGATTAKGKGSDAEEEQQTRGRLRDNGGGGVDTSK